MALVLDATVGGPNSNSYATRAEADAYFDGRMASSAWTSATNAEKDQALVAATNRLEQEKYLGTKASSAQRLKWPRVGALDDDGAAYDVAAVPRPIKEASYELAVYFLANKTTDTLAPSGLEPFTALKAGPLDITMNTDRTEVQRSGLPDVVVRLLNGLIYTYDIPVGTAPLPSTLRIKRG